MAYLTAYFYPRPPRGGRPSRECRGSQYRNFYPRPPRGGRQRQRPGTPPSAPFLSTPSARRATTRPTTGRGRPCDFYPRPPRGGRRVTVDPNAVASVFLSTPSARRATIAQSGGHVFSDISIHALREEGDRFMLRSLLCEPYFYPRPPRGGRLESQRRQDDQAGFLSTPSARRATLDSAPLNVQPAAFLSTPSARRATARRSAGCWTEY